MDLVAQGWVYEIGRREQKRESCIILVDCYGEKAKGMGDFRFELGVWEQTKKRKHMENDRNKSHCEGAVMIICCLPMKLCVPYRAFMSIVMAIKLDTSKHI